EAGADPAAEVVPIGIERLAQAVLQLLHGQRWVRRDGAGELERGRQQLLVWDDARHETDLARFCRVDDASGEQELGGALTSDQRREASDAGDVAAQSALHEELAEARLLGRDAQVG